MTTGRGLPIQDESGEAIEDEAGGMWLDGVAYTAEPERVDAIAAEDRTLVVDAEDRTLVVAAEDRTLVVSP